MESYLLPPIYFHGVMLSEALGLRLYPNTVVVSISNCKVLGSSEPHHWCSGPSANNLLHRLVDTELLQLTV